MTGGAEVVDAHVRAVGGHREAVGGGRDQACGQHLVVPADEAAEHAQAHARDVQEDQVALGRAHRRPRRRTEHGRLHRGAVAKKNILIYNNVFNLLFI